MRKKKSESSSKNTLMAVIFVACVFCIVLISLIIKGIFFLGQSKFDNVHNFSVLFSGGKKSEVVSFSPASKQISILIPDKEVKDTDLKNLLAIYLDGEVKLNSPIEDEKNVTSILEESLKNSDKAKTDLSVIDMVKLLIFSRTVSSDNITTSDISLSLTPSEMDEITAPLFNDQSITAENQSVEIINGAGVAGLGNWVSRVLTNMGVNVILVSNSDKPKGTSSIAYLGKKTYTVERLSSVLGFNTVESSQQSIADIVVTIGMDYGSRLAF